MKLKYFQYKRRPYKSYNNTFWEWKQVFDEIEQIKNRNTNYLEIISKKYGIVYGTLKNKYNIFLKNKENIIKGENRGGKNKFFTKIEEDNIFNILKTRYIDNDKPLNNNIIKTVATDQFDIFFTIKIIFSAFYLFFILDTTIDFLKYYFYFHVFLKKNYFKGSNFWCTNFKKRYRLSTQKIKASRIATTIVSDEKIKKYLNDAKRLYLLVGPSNFFNYDETNEKIANFPKTAIRIKMSDNVKINCCQNLKENVTVGITESSDGSFTNTFVIAKGKSEKCLAKFGIIPFNIKLLYSESGWATETIILYVLKNISKITNNKKSVLVLDRYPSHITKNIKNYAREHKIILLYVPEGYTYKYQPLDVGINSIIKIKLTKKFTNFLVHNESKPYTLNLFLNDLSDSLISIKKETIIKSFDCILKNNNDIL